MNDNTREPIDETARLTHVQLTVLHRSIAMLQAQIAASRWLIDESREALWRARQKPIVTLESTRRRHVRGGSLTSAS